MQVCMHRWFDVVSLVLTSILQVFCLYTPFHCQTSVPSQLLHTKSGHVCENSEKQVRTSLLFFIKYNQVTREAQSMNETKYL
ncbi:histone deacetylase 10 isoform X2 [Iris pallida]|uniref:Histone deacetylase 10 isoform X2 n=1 Tax=Iris pallida TaxID=29817 RepID=A0AAX6E1B2_IRIPA|nr:histone deacetylase 10 isoform X2 [Iris pallida]